MTIEADQSTSGAAHPAAGRQREIHFQVDGEPCVTDRHELTPNEIIAEFGRQDPTTHYLVRIEGHQHLSYKGKGDDPISIRDGERFQIMSTGPTPVSWR